MSNLIELLSYFRTNKYCLLSDIEKALLVIRLKQEADKNLFSFVVFHDGKYKYFRHNSVIFGFITSPFNLNYILNHVAQTCVDTTIREASFKQFYQVKNLFFLFLGRI